jgi:hypothetical protein
MALAVGLSACGTGAGGRSAPAAPVRIIAGVNDHPRNAGSPDFEARRAAAHARGFWLTDELNVRPGVTVHASNPGGGAAKTPGQLAQQSASQNACPDCGGDGGGASGGTTSGYSSVSVNSLTALQSDPAMWDTQISFADGTSMLGMEFDNGVLGVLEPDGWYTGYIPTVNGGLSPRQGYCVATTGVPDCWVPPKWVCPYASAGWGLLGKWGTIAAMRGKSSPLADGVGLIIGAGVSQFCNSVTGVVPWKDQHRVAASFNRLFS